MIFAFYIDFPDGVTYQLMSASGAIRMRCCLQGVIRGQFLSQTMGPFPGLFRYLLLLLCGYKVDEKADQ